MDGSDTLEVHSDGILSRDDRNIIQRPKEIFR